MQKGKGIKDLKFILAEDRPTILHSTDKQQKQNEAFFCFKSVGDYQKEITKKKKKESEEIHGGKEKGIKS